MKKQEITVKEILKNGYLIESNTTSMYFSYLKNIYLINIDIKNEKCNIILTIYGN